MNTLNLRVALRVRLTLARQEIQFFKRRIERTFPLPSRVRVSGLWLLLLLVVPSLADARAGTVTTDFGHFGEGARALVLQPDGKLVAAGTSRSGKYNFALARYLPDGRLDPTFGVGGKVITDLPGSAFGPHTVANALVLQPDGKLVAAGYIWFDLPQNRSHYDFALARYLPDGTLDPTFGVGGIVTTNFGTNSGAFALILQPDGKLVAAGNSGDDPDNDFALVRYLPDGTLDPNFGVGGILTTEFGGFEEAYALVLQPDGKLVAAGEFLGNKNAEFALARYLPDGRLDPTFGVGGKMTTDFGTGSVASALILQPDGKLVAAGPGPQGVRSENIALARYLPDGRLDPSFGVGGKVIGGNVIVTMVSALILQPDGKLVAAGAASNDCCTDRFGLVRYLPNGTLDPDFGVGGIATTDFFAPPQGGDSDEAWALVMQPDGKLVAAGLVGDFGVDFGLARYLTNGHLDATFGTGVGVNVNELVNVVVQSASLDPNPVSGGPAGVFTITALLTNTSPATLLEPINAIVKTLTNGNKLLSATEGDGGVTSKQAIDAGSDDTLISNESRTVQFRIGLANRNLFYFFVDVSGIISGDD